MCAGTYIYNVNIDRELVVFLDRDVLKNCVLYMSVFIDQGVRFVVLLSKWQQVRKFGFLWHDGDEREFHIFCRPSVPLQEGQA